MRNRLFLTIFALLFASTQSIAINNSPIASTKGMVVSEQHFASQIGTAILKAGGNAIDAAVAVGYALAVTDPCCGNLGGGGFMTIRLANGKTTFLNFRERAPLAATSSLYLDAKGEVIPGKSTVGYLAVATPGTVLGFETALNKYGTFTRQQVMSPAIQLAEKGFVLTKGDVKSLKNLTDYSKKQANVANIFLKNNQPYQTGDRLIQTDLANTLKQISEKGPGVFYHGNIAQTIIAASHANGGILSLQDFTQYNVEESKPLQCDYHQYTVISAPPPSSGGVTLCEILNILEKYPLKQYGYQSPESVHYEVEAMRYAFHDRNNQLGDPDFVNNPINKLISKNYAAEIRKNIPATTSVDSTKLGNISISHEGTNTTHYSVVDQWGNAVSVTYTLNSLFGAGVIAGDTGFFLNNEMDDFDAKPGAPNQFGLIGGTQNNILSGKRPLSSMTPTIVTKNNQVILIAGSRGGPRIITATVEAILNVFDYDMNIQAAVDAGRFHHQWLPDLIDIESTALPQQTINKLQTMGYHFNLQPSWGVVEAIYIDPITHVRYGANDSRQSAGQAVGY